MKRSILILIALFVLVFSTAASIYKYAPPKWGKFVDLPDGNQELFPLERSFFYTQYGIKPEKWVIFDWEASAVFKPPFGFTVVGADENIPGVFLVRNDDPELNVQTMKRHIALIHLDDSKK